MTEQAKHSLVAGSRWPYDASDAWWESEHTKPLPPKDWAHSAARGILHDLNDRRGIKQGFNGIDEDIRKEIAESIAAIIREAHSDTC